MTGVVVIGHGQIVDGLFSACDLIVGHHKHCKGVCLTEGVSSFTDSLYATLDEMFQNYESVIILSDVKGGTPFNQAFRYQLEKEKSNMVIIAGMNLPIMMELVMRLEEQISAEELAEEAVKAGQAFILTDDSDHS